MPCYRPLTAWQPLSGSDAKLRFSEPRANSDVKDCREIQIKCGRCIGCRIDRRESWAVRCYAESKMHSRNAFVTLTYSDDNLPSLYSLNYRDYQLFAKRLRKKLGPFRFFMCGEYGETLGRPHYHALLFGLDFPDKRKSNSLYSDFDLYESDILSDAWGLGHCSIGEVTYESARYCAVYATKKVTGELAHDHYTFVDPRTGEVGQRSAEFARMSLKPGIGYDWLQLYWRDLYETGHNAVIVNGSRKCIPRYFDDKLSEITPGLIDSIKLQRQQEVKHHNNTRKRLEVREACAHAKMKFNNERKSHAL